MKKEGTEKTLKAQEDSSEKIIDLTYLNDMSFSNENFVREMLSAFISDASMYLNDIKEGIKKQDPAEILAASHTLKSNVSYLGLSNLSDLLEDMQQLATSGVETNFNIMLDNIEHLLVIAIQEANIILKNHK